MLLEDLPESRVVEFLEVLEKDETEVGFAKSKLESRPNFLFLLGTLAKEAMVVLGLNRTWATVSP